MLRPSSQNATAPIVRFVVSIISCKPAGTPRRLSATVGKRGVMKAEGALEGSTTRVLDATPLHTAYLELTRTPSGVQRLTRRLWSPRRAVSQQLGMRRNNKAGPSDWKRLKGACLGRVLINPERSQTWRCPRYPQKPTSGLPFGTSALGQKRAFLMHPLGQPPHASAEDGEVKRTHLRLVSE